MTEFTARLAGTGEVVVTVAFRYPAVEARGKVLHVVGNDGKVHVSVTFEPGPTRPEIPRIGMQVLVPGRYDRLDWFGRGPHENYADRCTGAAVGRYGGKVGDLIHPYIRPQENGNRTGVRWLTLTSEAGRGLRVEGIQPLSVSAWPYHMEDLETAMHDHELPRRDSITLNIDHRQMGVGGDDSWGAKPHKQYLLPCRPYRYGFVISEK